jgi:hypothetical protein
MRILAIDIETSPNVAHVWGLWNQNVGLNQLLQSQEMICFSAKWLGEDEIQFWSGFHDGQDVMVQHAHQLLDEADVILHYNGKRFDVPHLNREFLLAGLFPPAPFQQIDLYSTVKKRFRFPSNKLDYVSRALGLEGKVHHEGHELWVRCLAGDMEAWTLMETYNKQDVVLLEQMYEKLLPWIPSHPSKTLIDGIHGCSACGGQKMKAQGYAYTGVSKYQKFQCLKCGKWTRGSKMIERADQREVAL